MATSESEPIGLIELLERLKADLLSAGADSVPMFSIDEVKLDLKFTVSRSGEGGIDLHVVKGDLSERHDDVQTVTVTLTPWESKKKRLKSMPPEKKEQMKAATNQISTRHSTSSLAH